MHRPPPFSSRSVHEDHHVSDISRILGHISRELNEIRHALHDPASKDRSVASIASLEDVLARAEADIRAKTNAFYQSTTDSFPTTLPIIQDRPGARHISTWEERSSIPPMRRPYPLAGDLIKAELEQGLLAHPTSSAAREFLADRYGVPLSSARTTRNGISTRKKGIRSAPSTYSTLGVSPADARKGLMHLVNRGLIPTGADISHALIDGPATFQSSAAPLYLSPDFGRRALYDTPIGYNPAMLKFDVSSANSQRRTDRRSSVSSLASSRATAEVSVKNLSAQMPDHTSQYNSLEPRSYHTLLDECSLHEFFIRKGIAMESTPEFISYKRLYAAFWPQISYCITQLETYLRKLEVPSACIDGKHLAQIAMDDLTKPSIADLLSCIQNRDEITALQAQALSKMRSSYTPELAAAKLQATFKMYRQRARYQPVRKACKAAKRIQGQWRVHRHVLHRQETVKRKREETLDTFKKLMADFVNDWPKIKSRKRVLVHIPSLSYDRSQRISTENVTARQNSQISRILDALDENQEVVYVSPFPLSDEVQQYYFKLLQVGGMDSPDSRCRIVYPENFERFPSTISLTTVLICSPKAMRRVRDFCRGKRAYIVPGVVSTEERKLCVALHLPMLAPDPAFASVYSSKSGAKRMFMAAQVNVPVGATDLYDQSEIYQKLSKLIVANQNVPRWLFKIDDEYNGRGHCYFDTAALDSLLKKDETTSPEELTDLIAKELPDALKDSACTAVPDLFPNWTSFVETLTRIGGVIEACQQNVIASPSVNFLIEPDGTVEVLNSHDQLFSPPFCYAGCVSPQTAVPEEVLRDATIAVGMECYKKGLFGYMGIDYVVAQQKDSLDMFAVDLNFGLSNSACVHRMYELFTSSPSPEDDNDGATSQREQPRSYVYCDYLSHPRISTFQYQMFFNLCRLKGLVFDLEVQVGPVLILLDNFARGAFGLLCIGTSQREAAKIMVDTLEFLQAQIIGTRKDMVDVNVGTFKSMYRMLQSLLSALEQEEENNSSTS